MKKLLLFLGLLGFVAACDAGPSAVLPDKPEPALTEQTQKPPFWAEDEKTAPETAPLVEQSENLIPEDQETPPQEAVVTKAVPLNLKSLIGQKQAITDTTYGDWPLWSSNRKYSADDNAHYHFKKHGQQFGVRDYETYVALSHGFVHQPPKGTETLRRNNGDTLYYNAALNIFAVTTKDGAPRTLFRPDNGAQYWQKQKQREAGRRTVRD